ncbi:MAG TPA: oligosaccharide flippase family protein [Acidimicrobiia bacterium]|nr:oligosaccharide flippase family protein [Acidimicrobiia bacterium]
MPADERPYRRRVLLNTASTSAATVWSMVVMLVWVPLLLHGLGASAFGVWALLQAFSATNGWLSVAELGIGTSITTFVAERAARDEHDEAAAVGRAGTVVLLVIGVICAIAMVAFGLTAFAGAFHVPHSLRDDLRVAIPFFAVQIVPDLLLKGSTSELEGHQRVDLSRVVDGARRTLVAATTSVVALAGGGLAGVAIASLVATAVAAMFGAALAHRVGGRATARGWTRQLRPVAAYSWRVALVDAQGVLHRSMDRVIVGAAIGPEAVALVEIATQVQNAANAVLAAASYAVISSSAWLRSRGDHASLRELLERGTRYSLLVTWPFAVGIAVLAGPLIHVWVGGRYHDAAGLVAVALVPLVAAPFAVGSNMLRGTGRISRVLWPAVAATTVNLVASIVLVNRYGIVGVFVGTIIGTAVLVPSLGRAVLDEYGVTVREFLGQAVVPALVPNLILFAVALATTALLRGAVVTIAVTAVVGALVYALATLRIGLRHGEARELVGVVRRQPA